MSKLEELHRELHVIVELIKRGYVELYPDFYVMQSKIIRKALEGNKSHGTNPKT